MKVTLELPDWVEESRLMILAGVELVATKVPWENFWKVKNTRCDLCGQCCMTKPYNPWGVDEEGKCLMLRRQTDGTWECSAGLLKPYQCLKDPNDEPECCITYDRVKVSK
jgi:MinD superfamily P-loop ATPase